MYYFLYAMRSLGTCRFTQKYSFSFPKYLTHFIFPDCSSLRGSVNSDVILIDGGTHVHNRAAFVCHTGYSLEGNSTVTCLETGQWNFSPPACIIVGK